MAGAFRRVRARMDELGLSFSVWDLDGLGFGRREPTCEFCTAIHCAAEACTASASQLVARVNAEGRAAWQVLPGGCCVLGVPVRKRRRQSGTAVACFPTTAFEDDEFLARRCDELLLDRQVVAAAAEGVRFRDPAEGADLLAILEWLLEAEQEIQTANGELTTLSTNLSTTYEELSLLYTISGSMKVTQRPAAFLRDVCDELLEVMNISAAAAVIHAHPPAVPDDIVVVTGRIDLEDEQLGRLARKYFAPELAREPRPIVDNQFRCRSQPELGKGIRNVICVPVAGDQQLGMLLTLNKNAGDFSSTDIKLVNSIANQSAVFMANNILYADLQDLLMGVLHALTATIDAKDPYTCGHSNRVAVISKRLAEECGLAPARVQQIYLAGLLHDIGKIGVPESTLCKPGRLTEEEYDQVKRHPGIGAKILGGIRQLDDVISGILCHHERLDGGGYPQGLTAEDLPLDARIIGLADCFDAMTSDRIYRKALPLEVVIREIGDHAGTQFDPEVAGKLLAMDLEAFLEELREPAETVFPVGLAQEDAT